MIIGAQTGVKSLERQGVEVVFAMRRAQDLELIDVLADAEVLAFLAARGLSTALMAGGFARASGKIGILTFTLTLQKIRRRKTLRSRKAARTKGVLTFFGPHLGCTKLRPEKVPRALVSSLFLRFRSTFFTMLRFISRLRKGMAVTRWQRNASAAKRILLGTRAAIAIRYPAWEGK